MLTSEEEIKLGYSLHHIESGLTFLMLNHMQYNYWVLVPMFPSGSPVRWRWRSFPLAQSDRVKKTYPLAW